jgi:hypothetical protein
MFTRVNLTSPRQLPAALRKHEILVERAMRKAMIKTARFGITAVQKTIRQTDPKPYAFGTYSQSWAIQKTKTGAIFGSSAKHSIFVEVGRRPGRMPPLEPILEWVRIKRLGIPKATKKIGAKTRRPATKKTASQKAANAAKRSAAGTGGKPKRSKKPSKGAIKKANAQRSFAFMVQRKIGKKGTKGRYILLRTMPTIQKRADKELKREVAKALKKATR